MGTSFTQWSPYCSKEDLKLSKTINALRKCFLSLQIKWEVGIFAHRPSLSYVHLLTTRHYGLINRDCVTHLKMALNVTNGIYQVVIAYEFCKHKQKHSQNDIMMAPMHSHAFISWTFILPVWDNVSGFMTKRKTGMHPLAQQTDR